MGTPQKDVVIKPDAPSTLLSEKHADYIASYGTKKDDYIYEGTAQVQRMIIAREHVGKFKS